jgi:hypothetical protein
MPYQVDTADGACLYRGNDLELACDLHDHAPFARLVVLPPMSGMTGPDVGDPAQTVLGSTRWRCRDNAACRVGDPACHGG